MATISNTPRPGYVWDATDNCWYPIGTGPHSHADYITSGSAINPNIVDAKGDIIAATAADTVSRLAVGSNDQVLTADSSTATGLKWASPAAGGMTQLATGTLSGGTVSLSSISGSYTNLLFILFGWTNDSANGQPSFRPNGSTSIVDYSGTLNDNGTYSVVGGRNGVGYFGTTNGDRTSALNSGSLLIYNYASTSGYKPFQVSSGYKTTTGVNANNLAGHIKTTSAITSMDFYGDGGNFNGGTYILYGVK